MLWSEMLFGEATIASPEEYTALRCEMLNVPIGAAKQLFIFTPKNSFAHGRSPSLLCVTELSTYSAAVD